ncbi:hypothetical protein BJX62DRAFT_23734 [Aspergillus germanicus]
MLSSVPHHTLASKTCCGAFHDLSESSALQCKENEFCDEAQQMGDLEIVLELENMIQQLRAFRATHRGPIHRYLSAPAPERLIMTTGKLVLESEEIPEIDAAIEYLDGLLAKRFGQTRWSYTSEMDRVEARRVLWLLGWQPVLVNRVFQYAPTTLYRTFIQVCSDESNAGSSNSLCLSPRKGCIRPTRVSRPKAPLDRRD